MRLWFFCKMVWKKLSVFFLSAYENLPTWVCSACLCARICCQQNALSPSHGLERTMIMYNHINKIWKKMFKVGLQVYFSWLRQRSVSVLSEKHPATYTRVCTLETKNWIKTSNHKANHVPNLRVSVVLASLCETCTRENLSHAPHTNSQSGRLLFLRKREIRRCIIAT